jgi:hypothetical protein
MQHAMLHARLILGNYWISFLCLSSCASPWIGGAESLGLVFLVVFVFLSYATGRGGWGAGRAKAG